MRLIKPMAASVLTRPVQYRGRTALSVSCLLSADIAQACDFLYSEASLWRFLGAQFGGTPLVDEVVLKQHPEFLVHGAAFAPGGSAQRVAVRARVGALEKMLVATGDRWWVDDQRATEPVPFDFMPLRWPYAYGGGDFAANPVGKGAAPLPLGDTRAYPLPNLEYAHAPQAGPGVAVPPAALGAIPLDWPERAQWRGSYDEQWYHEDSPGFARDLDWRFFNAALPDQWFASDLAGDETIELEHMHPTEPLVAGRLPGVRARVFVGHDTQAGAPSREVPMRLTTVWLFPHVRRQLVVFQGLAYSAEPDGSDVAHLLVGIERLAEPRTDAHYHAAFQARMDPQDGPLHGLDDAPLLPEGMPIFDPDLQALVDENSPLGLAAQAKQRGAERRVAKLRSELLAKGLDPDQYGLRAPAPPVRPTLQQLPQYIKSQREAATAAQEQAAIAAVDAAQRSRKLLDDLGLSAQALAPSGPPKFSALAQVEQLMAVVPAGIPGPDGKPFAMTTIAAQLVQFELLQRDVYRQSAHAQPAARSPGEPVLMQRRATVTSRLAEGGSLATEDLTLCDLRGVNLSQADLRDAFLEGAQLAGVDATSAVFSGAVLARADLQRACLAGARLDRANLGRALVRGAVFDHADLRGAILAELDLSGAQLRRAVLTGARIDGTTFGDCDLARADLSGLVFIERDLRATTLAGANLSSASFIDCDLSGTDFAMAQLEGARFVGCKLVGARLHSARLGKASFTMGCDLTDARLDAADLGEANLREARLAGADLRTARLDGADLSGAFAANARLDRASLKRALLVRTDLTGASATQCDLMDAIAQMAILKGTDLSDCQLVGMDLSRARRDAATRITLAADERVRLYPKAVGEEAL